MTTLPSFYVRIDRMYASTPSSQTRPGYPWRPPRAHRANLTDTNHYLGANQVFYFDGRSEDTDSDDSMQEPHLDIVPMELPARLRRHPFQCYSMYAGTNADIWTVPYNASENQVYDGDNSRRNTSELSADHLPDWKELRFRQARCDTEEVSYAEHNGSERHLLARRRRNQPWVTQIIPPQYRGQRVLSDNSDRGALVGDIALLIGLLALSIPQPLVMRVLPHLMKRTWSCVGPEKLVVDDNVRVPQRGVIITIWIDEPSSQSSDPRETAIRLLLRRRWEQYQEGHLGLIFE